MGDLVPYLTFRDGDASLRFLQDGLGFGVTAEQRSEDGAVVHAELARGDDVIMGGSGDVASGASPGLYLAVEADEVDALFEQSVAAGAAVVHAPEDTEWGTRRARVRDPDGHEWSFGSYRPGQSW